MYANVRVGDPLNICETSEPRLCDSLTLVNASVSLNETAWAYLAVPSEFFECVDMAERLHLMEVLVALVVSSVILLVLSVGLYFVLNRPPREKVAPEEVI